MMSIHGDPSAGARRAAYAVLIFLGVGGMIGRILAVDAIGDSAVEEYRVRKELDNKRKAYQAEGLKGDSLDDVLVNEEARIRDRIRMRRPFLSANDRSRWCTIRALVEPDMRVPGKPYAIDHVVEQPTWDTIDMVKFDGHFYSSKPTLLPTIYAGVYWVIYNVNGYSLADDTFEVVRLMLIIVNVIPLAIYFWILSRLAERFGRTDFGRIFMMAAGTLATFLTTFAVVLNNHLPGAVAVIIAFYAWTRIWFDEERRLRYFAIAGLFGAFGVTCELPALAFLGLLGASLLWKAWRPTLLALAPAAAVVTIASFGTNWIAVQSLRPAYAHRSATDPEDNWYRFTYERHGKTVASYWSDPQGIDRGESSRAAYIFHCFVGHHGIFSLTPVWLLSAIGMLMWCLHRRDGCIWQMALGILLLTVVVTGFYLARPLVDRNYGGNTAGLRWIFWLAPLWLVTMLPAADWVSERRWARWVALPLLAASVLSVSYPIWNPWSHPWLYHFSDYMNWL